jgi:guanylate kinase
MLVIISGPSGVGKSTITNAIVQRLDAALSISMTTRPRAVTDVDGQHYHFVDEPTFRKAIADDALLEWAEVYGNLYGTPRAFVENNMDAGRLVVLEIDVKGARQVRQKLPDAFAIFILAPDDESLLHRLRLRKRDDEATIQCRFSRAQVEIADARSADMYQFVINDQFERAVDEVAKLIDQEHRRRMTRGYAAGRQR